MLLLNTSKPSSIQNNVLKKLRRFLSVLFPWCKTSYIKLGFIHRLIYMPVNSYSCLRFSTGYSLLRCSVAQSLKKVPSRSTVCPFRHFIRLSLKNVFYRRRELLGKAFVLFIQFCTKHLLQDKICFVNWNEANQSIEMSGKEAAKEKSVLY